MFKASQEIHTLATSPLYLVWFVLDTTDFPPHNPARLLLRLLGVCQLACRGHWGKHDAILARLDRAMHQSGMFRARPLATRASLRPECGIGVLPKLRKYIAGSAAADRTTAAHEAACACRAPAAATKTSLRPVFPATRIFLRVNYGRRTRNFCLFRILPMRSIILAYFGIGLLSAAVANTARSQTPKAPPGVTQTAALPTYPDSASSLERLIKTF